MSLEKIRRFLAGFWYYFKRFLFWASAAIFGLLLTWVLWSLVAYRDIPVEALEQRYGDGVVKIVELDGTPLRYRDQGEGPALLLIHSHYFNMRMWNDWVPGLANNFRVISFDMSSHGLTGPDARGDYSMERDLDLILGLLEHLQVQQFSVVGSSLGGNQAFNLAGRYPQRVEKLVLINSGGIPREGSRATQGTIPAWVDYLTYLVPTAAFRAFLEWMIFDDRVVTAELVEEFHAMFRREGNRFAEFERLRSFRVGDPTEVLAAVRAPVLLMWGEDNPQLPVSQMTVLAEMLENAAAIELVSYPEVGHVLPLEIPAVASERVAEFLLRPGGDE